MLYSANLKYLFYARFSDGSVFRQDPKDVSELEPDKRSSFYDLTQRGLDRIQTFWLTDGVRTFLVDLRDGHFEVDGVSIHIDPKLPKGARAELIYYRRHYQFTRMNVDKLDAVTGEVNGRRHILTPTGHEIEFHFGWQSTVEMTGYDVNGKQIVEHRCLKAIMIVDK